jgi:hypothetical protein
MAAPPRRAGRPTRFWPALIGGLAATAAGVVLYLIADGFPEARRYLDPPRAALIFGGLVAAGAAVSRRLRSAGQEFEDRAVSAGVVFLAGVAAFQGYIGAGDADSLQMALGVLTAVAVAGSLLVLLPRGGRYVAVSLLVLVHFSSITTSVLSVPPPRSSPPWLLQTAWAHFYRPYSSFMYLNNAYHFYSPEPGPPTLLWFYVRYSDGSSRWVKLPSRADSPVPLHYQRMLALTESTNMINPELPPDFLVRKYRRLNLARPPIPLLKSVVPGMLPSEYPDVPDTLQFQEPQEYSKKMVAGYVRYVARRYAHPEAPAGDPQAHVDGIKAYRVIHSIINAPDLAAGASPHAKTFDLPYFQGEFDTGGELKNTNDPLLYWLIPIQAWPRDADKLKVFNAPVSPHKDFDVRDYLEVHAAYVAPERREEKP